MGKREDRKAIIKKIVRTYNIRTQRDLVDYLNKEGCICTQATISRDISDLGLMKAYDGAYVLPEDLNLKKLVVDLVTNVEQAGNLVVIKLMPGAASGVAAALDAAESQYLIGTIAGDDTILAIARTENDAREFSKSILHLKG